MDIPIRLTFNASDDPIRLESVVEMVPEEMFEGLSLDELLEFMGHDLESIVHIEVFE